MSPRPCTMTTIEILNEADDVCDAIRSQRIEEWALAVDAEFLADADTGADFFANANARDER